MKKELRLSRYVPFLIVPTVEGLKRQRNLPPGTVIGLGGKRYIVGMHQEIRRVGRPISKRGRKNERQAEKKAGREAGHTPR